MLATLVAIVALASCRPPPLPEGVAPVGTGYRSSCALTASSGVQCWGEGSKGQLGNGTTQDSVTPVDVVGLSSGVQAITTGEFGACALTDGGGVKCWGDNAKGQVGGSLDAFSAVPVDVMGLASGVTQVESYSNHSCALLATGDVQCWGNNFGGELGDNKINQHSNVPVAATVAPSPTVRLGSGITAACGVASDGTVTCWGGNRFGTKLDLDGLTDVVEVTAGDLHVCAVTSTGGVRCWGENAAGQLGNGSPLNLFENPVSNVVGLSSEVTGVTAGNNHTCALTTAGAVKCWGSNSDGQLGNPTTTLSSVPVDAVDASKAVRAINAGDRHTCALINGGSIRCWGRPGDGQTGFGWAEVPQPTEAVSVGTGPIAAGAAHTCAAKAGGGVTCWGDAGDGRLGFGSGAPPQVPVDVVGLSGVAALTAGDRHSCALTTAGAVRCWGANDQGQLGNGWINTAYAPTTVFGLSSDVVSITGGANHTCAVTATGATVCWGANDQGQLGNGTTATALAPVAVTGLPTGATGVAAGANHTCATANGSALCWGQNTFGQLGDFTTASSTIPVNVFGLTTGVTALAGGTSHTCAIVAGGVKCWGIGGPGASGELGNDPSSGSAIPVDVAGLSAGATALDAGATHTCAVANGVTACWGNNDNFQIGNGTQVDALQAIAPTGLGNDSLAVAAGDRHTCAINTSGIITCWGSNDDRQLGTSSATTEITGGVFYNDTVSPA